MSNKVNVYDISEKASEKTVKDFFLFCGKIKDFELCKEECSDKQIAYVTFERATAAKTALMLTNAVIGDSQITVKPSEEANTGYEESEEGDIQENKPKAAICAEILAAGYTLQDTIIEKGIEFDAKTGLSIYFKQYFAQLQANLKTLNEQYKVTETVTSQATTLNEKYSVLDNAKYVIDQAQEKVTAFLETSAGKNLSEYILSSQKQVADVQSLARKIADDKKKDSKKQLTYHSHSEDVQPETQLISQ